MKKAVCILVAVLMCMNGLAVAMAEYEFTSIEGTFISAMDFSAEEWMKSSMHRALLTVALTIDVQLEDIPYEPDFLKGSYVGRSDNHLLVIVGTEEENVALTITYNPYLNTIGYLFVEGVSSFDMFSKTALADVCADGYYKNNIFDIKEVTDTLLEILK